MDEKVSIVVNRQPCTKHDKPKLVGEPCWYIHLADGTVSHGICNWRAKKAGFNARIHPSSLRAKK